MKSPRSATRRALTTATSILVFGIGAPGCGGDETTDPGSQLAEVTANDFADLAAASAEAARAACMAEPFSRGIGRTVYPSHIEAAPVVAIPAGSAPSTARSSSTWARSAQSPSSPTAST